MRLTVMPSLVYNDEDTGRRIAMQGQCGRPLVIRRHARRRILGNLIGTPDLPLRESHGWHIDVAIRAAWRGPHAESRPA